MAISSRIWHYILKWEKWTLQKLPIFDGFLRETLNLVLKTGMTPEQVRLVVSRTLRQIADMAIPKRRQRSCPRALRQPVSSWPRLRKNTSQTGAIDYTVGQIYA